jgi:restriction system protein
MNANNSMTIVGAIKEVLLTAGKPLTSKEIYNAIIAGQLYHFGAKTPEGLVNNKIRKHCYGLDFPSASPVKHFVISSKTGAGTYYELLNAKSLIASNGDQSKQVDQRFDDRIPEERLIDAYLEHRSSVKAMLLDKVLSSPPAFFERLVLDLLLAMGYGGSVSNAGLVSGSPGDCGIDGIIKEDELGLGKIYIQAKRYTDKKVGRPDLQQFVGAMENVQKGVFITTSAFSGTAIAYIEKQQKSIVLINGEDLCDLLVTHGVGVSTLKNFSTYRIDTDYFSEE